MKSSHLFLSKKCKTQNPCDNHSHEADEKFTTGQTKQHSMPKINKNTVEQNIETTNNFTHINSFAFYIGATTYNI